MLGMTNYDALPGHKVTLKDGNLNLRNDPGASPTESVVFLGTATDGPVNEPIRVTPENAYSIFGKVTFDNGIPNGATLLPAFEEAWQAGNRDIRLMRVTGENAFSSISGASYTKTTEKLASQEFVAHGNEEVTFTLPHGGIVTGTLVVRANGQQLDPSKYTADLGVKEDIQAGLPADPGSILILTDSVDMEAEITVSYTYEVTEADGTTSTYDVVENNTDGLGAPMIAYGYSKDYSLNFIPKAGLKLYANGREVVDPSAFTVNAAAKTVTVNTTELINLKDGLEVSYKHDETNVIEPTIKLESVFGGTLYNRTAVKVDKSSEGIVTVTISKPKSKKAIMSEPAMTFRSVDFPNYQLMVNAINTHPMNNVVRAEVDKEFAGQLTEGLVVKPETLFSGGADEIQLDADEMYVRLGGEKDADGFVVKPGAYQYLENYKVDFVVPLGVHSDDELTGKYDNFAYQLALACAIMSHYNSVTNGVISTSTPNTTTLMDIENHVKKLESQPNEFYMRDRFGEIITDGEGEMFDVGQFIQIVAGPDLLVGNTRLGGVASNSGATYTGFVSQLAVQSAPTNKTMPTAAGLRFEYSAPQLNRLTKARYVTYKIKPDNTVGIVDAMTAAHTGSDYTRVSTARIVKETLNQVREVADPYIGETNDIETRNALAAALDKRLNKMVEARALLGFSFQIVATEEMELIGEASIELSLRAPNELRSLTTVTSLSA